MPLDRHSAVQRGVHQGLGTRMSTEQVRPVDLPHSDHPGMVEKGDPVLGAELRVLRGIVGHEAGDRVEDPAGQPLGLVEEHPRTPRTDDVGELLALDDGGRHPAGHLPVHHLRGADPGQVGVTLDQPRRDQVPAQLDALGRLSSPRQHLLVRAHEGDPAIGDRHAPALLELFGEDVDERAPGQDQVGLGPSRRHGREPAKRVTAGRPQCSWTITPRMFLPSSRSR